MNDSMIPRRGGSCKSTGNEMSTDTSLFYVRVVAVDAEDKIAGRKDVRLTRVPCVGEKIELDGDRMVRVETVIHAPFSTDEAPGQLGVSKDVDRRIHAEVLGKLDSDCRVGSESPPSDDNED